MSGTHDKNSPSQLKKRQLCPGSFNLEVIAETKKPLPDIITEYSLRGECLHLMPRLAIDKGATFEVGETISYGGSGAGYVLERKDIEHAEFCINEVRSDMSLLEKDDTVLWEQQVDLTKYGIGSSKDGNRIDCVFLKQRSIDIYEFKFGSGYVDEPKYNLQVIAYAIGARDAFGVPIEGVNVTVLQPDAFKDEWRRRTYSFTNEELALWEKKIIDIIENEKDMSAPLCRGEHCIFCKVKQICPMHRDAFMNIPQHVAPDDYFQTIDPEQRKNFYEGLIASKDWISKAIEACEELIFGGVEISGYHIGSGRMSRKWNRPDTELIEKFSSLLVEKIMTPAEAEKQHGKKFFRENMELFVDTVEGNPKVTRD